MNKLLQFAIWLGVWELHDDGIVSDTPIGDQLAREMKIDCWWL